MNTKIDPNNPYGKDTKANIEDARKFAESLQQAQSSTPTLRVAQAAPTLPSEPSYIPEQLPLEQQSVPAVESEKPKNFFEKIFDWGKNVVQNLNPDALTIGSGIGLLFADSLGGWLGKFLQIGSGIILGKKVIDAGNKPKDNP
jgi:hypothetical protein